MTILMPSTRCAVDSLEIQTYLNTTQRAVGKLVIYGDRMIRTVYPETPMERELRLAKKAAKDEAYAAANGGEMPVKKGRTANKGWTAKSLANAKTRVNTTELKPLYELVEKNMDTHVAFMVLTYPARRITLPEEVQKDLVKFNRELRKTGSPYIRNIEFKWSKQAHINYVAALTKDQVKHLQRVWAKIAGWGKDASLGEAANYTLSNTMQEKHLGARSLFERCLNYMFMIGTSETAALKSHQYRMPDAWINAEGGTGSMWSMSSDLVQMETTVLPITNMSQREAIDGYVKVALGIEDKMVQWQLADGSLTREFNLAAFSKDRIAGSKHVARISPRLKRNVNELVSMYS